MAVCFKNSRFISYATRISYIIDDWHLSVFARIMFSKETNVGSIQIGPASSIRRSTQGYYLNNNYKTYVKPSISMMLRTAGGHECFSQTLELFTQFFSLKIANELKKTGKELLEGLKWFRSEFSDADKKNFQELVELLGGPVESETEFNNESNHVYVYCDDNEEQRNLESSSQYIHGDADDYYRLFYNCRTYKTSTIIEDLNLFREKIIVIGKVEEMLLSHAPSFLINSETEPAAVLKISTLCRSSAFDPRRIYIDNASIAAVRNIPTIIKQVVINKFTTVDAVKNIPQSVRTIFINNAKPQVVASIPAHLKIVVTENTSIKAISSLRSQSVCVDLANATAVENLPANIKMLEIFSSQNSNASRQLKLPSSVVGLNLSAINHMLVNYTGNIKLLILRKYRHDNNMQVVIPSHVRLVQLQDEYQEIFDYLKQPQVKPFFVFYNEQMPDAEMKNIEMNNIEMFHKQVAEYGDLWVKEFYKELKTYTAQDIDNLAFCLKNCTQFSFLLAQFLWTSIYKRTINIDSAEERKTNLRIIGALTKWVLSILKDNEELLIRGLAKQGSFSFSSYKLMFNGSDQHISNIVNMVNSVIKLDDTTMQIAANHQRVRKQFRQ